MEESNKSLMAFSDNIQIDKNISEEDKMLIEFKIWNLLDNFKFLHTHVSRCDFIFVKDNNGVSLFVNIEALILINGGKCFKTIVAIPVGIVLIFASLCYFRCNLLICHLNVIFA